MNFIRSKHNAIEPHGRRDPMDLEDPIHSLEIEAYRAVLKAFFAQSDLLSWGKEDIISYLRKELNVTDAEHRAILIAVRSDESVKSIREQKTWSTHAENCVKVNNPGYASGSIISKTSSPVPYLPPKNISHCQSSLASFPIRSSMPGKKVHFDMGNIDPVVVDKARSPVRFRTIPAHQGAKGLYLRHFIN